MYSKYHRRRRFLQYNFMDPGWGGAEFPTGGGRPPAGAGAGQLCGFYNSSCQILVKLKNFWKNCWSSYVKISQSPVFWDNRQIATVAMETTQLVLGLN